VHPGNEDLGPAFEPFGVGWTDAILRPPMPVIKPAQEPDR